MTWCLQSLRMSSRLEFEQHSPLAVRCKAVDFSFAQGHPQRSSVTPRTQPPSLVLDMYEFLHALSGLFIRCEDWQGLVQQSRHNSIEAGSRKPCVQPMILEHAWREPKYVKQWRLRLFSNCFGHCFTCFGVRVPSENFPQNH